MLEPSSSVVTSPRRGEVKLRRLSLLGLDTRRHDAVDLLAREHADLCDENDPRPRYALRQRSTRDQCRPPAGELKHHLPSRLLHRLEQPLRPRELSVRSHNLQPCKLSRLNHWYL